MGKIKIIFFDIDGTLIDMQIKQISEKMIETLQKLKKNGIKLCIATGRAPITLPKIKEIEFDAWLTFNGSLCYDRMETIYSNPICLEDVQKIVGNASAIGRPVSVATKEHLAANGTDKDLEEYYSFAHQSVVIAEDFEDIICQEEIYQVMLGCRESDYSVILEDVEGAKITAWWDHAADIIPANGGKGMGIQKMLEHYQLDRSEALAFGDGNNDIEMLQTVGTGVAMENASADLKAIADEICGNVAEDGIYHYCIENGLI